MRVRAPRTHGTGAFASSAALLRLAPFLLVLSAFGSPRGAAAQSPADQALRARVEAALSSASDVPADSITVQVRGGVVTLTGSVTCDECGGSSTPPGAGTVQQSLGALVRAIPGVERVEFRLRYGPA